MALSLTAQYACRVVAPANIRGVRARSSILGRGGQRQIIRVHSRKQALQIARAYAQAAAATPEAPVVDELIDPLPQTKMFKNEPDIVQQHKVSRQRSLWWIGLAMLNTAYMGHLSFVMMDPVPIFTGCIMFMVIDSMPSSIPAIAASYKPWSSGVKYKGKAQVAEASAVTKQMKGANVIRLVLGAGAQSDAACEGVTALVNKLAAHGKDVQVVLHPEAGRLHEKSFQRGLARANLPAKYIHEVTDFLGHDLLQFDDVDLVLAIGANDTINASSTDPEAPNYNRDVFPVWNAKQCVVVKRSLEGRGYSDITNPTFVKPNTTLLLGEADQICNNLATSL